MKIKKFKIFESEGRRPKRISIEEFFKYIDYGVAPLTISQKLKIKEICNKKRYDYTISNEYFELFPYSFCHMEIVKTTDEYYTIVVMEHGRAKYLLADEFEEVLNYLNAPD